MMGVMRMISAVDVSWIADQIPKLKDEVDVQKLSSTKQQRDR